MTTNHYDIIIAGGGLIGVTLALALADSPWRIALIEAKPPPNSTIVTDGRALALSQVSHQIFELLGILLTQTALIKKIHISEQGQFGSVLLDCQDSNLPALGYVVPIQILYQNLYEQLKNRLTSRITIYQPETIATIDQQSDQWQIQLATQQKLMSNLLIAADGEKSFIRETLKIATTIKDYQQTAIVRTLQVNLPNPQQAYERFTAQGILALLPFAPYKMVSIWTGANKQAELYLNQSDADYLSTLQKMIGYRVGKILQMGERYHYPIRDVQPSDQTHAGLILLGNAAHTLHPVAAQSFNLSLRDTITLANLLKKVDHLPNTQLIADYLKLRANDQSQTLKFTQKLVQYFSPQQSFLPLLRGLGMASFDLLPFLKRRFIQHRMGQY